MRCLITGVAGFIGSQLAEYLLSAGHDVIGIDALTNYYDPAIKRANMANLHAFDRFQLVEADLVTADLATLVADQHWIFHLAAQPGVRMSWGDTFAEYDHHNIMGTQRLLEALHTAREQGSTPLKLVYASSSSVYGAAPLPQTESVTLAPLSPYGVTKLAAEHMVLAYGRNDGIPVIALRFFTVYGPRQRPDMAFHRFIRAILQDEPVTLYGDGMQTRDFTYVADVVNACVVAAQSPHEGVAINVGGGSRVTVNETLSYLGELLDKQPIIQHVGSQRGDAPHTQAATERAQDLLHWAPKVAWQEGLRQQVEWQVAISKHSAIPLAVDSRLRAATPLVGTTIRPVTLQGTDASESGPLLLKRRQGPRLVLYGHDTYGLGHLRRNLVLANGLTKAFPDLSILLLTGSPVAQEYTMPGNVDYVKLPSVVKMDDETYHARTLHVEPGEISQMRSAIIREAIGGFAPDVVLVDHAPLGMKGEMLAALRDLRQQRPQARIALGLRDIIDDPERVRATWRLQGIPAILKELYDRILVYGVPEVMDVASAYALTPEIVQRLHYCGYIARDKSHDDIAALRRRIAPHGERVILVTAGGGGDGQDLFQAYLRSVAQGEIPADTVSVLNTGPFLAEEARADLQDFINTIEPAHSGDGGEQKVTADRVRLLPFTTDLPAYLQAADLVVCMGGYNTLCEVISVRARALVIPRSQPRLEQVIRARAFADLGLVHLLPGNLGELDLLGATVTDLLNQSHEDPHRLAMAGFAAIGALDGMAEVIGTIRDLLLEATRQPRHEAVGRRVPPLQFVHSSHSEDAQ